MNTISAPTSGMAMQNALPDPVQNPASAGPCGASESFMMSMIAEAERLMGDSARKLNSDESQAAIMRTEAAWQKKRAAVFEGCNRELDAAWWRKITKIATGLFSMFGGALSLGSAVGAGNQVNKAFTEGTLASMTQYTDRGNKVDTWSRVGQTAQSLPQGVGALAASYGESETAEAEVRKRYQDVEGQMSDNDAQVTMELWRKRYGDASEATRRVDKINETRAEYLRSAVRILA
ncbi:hypothetical protein [Bordetella bronchialis]|uniref:Uncharacterized protein n=1 Tax=Bordetella bronchialis TaxID=463025 RepID=A0A193G0P9_9BORD|nr:hypothetical protein [Bordetella bronchialis]ANN68300.1 hypothetical protein BAU06_20140 [Bordetella bronchialis]ANN73440.1 hypothetical protein BAU08_20670 [Bordetella bronchialis]